MSSICYLLHMFCYLVNIASLFVLIDFVVLALFPILVVFVAFLYFVVFLFSFSFSLCSYLLFLFRLGFRFFYYSFPIALFFVVGVVFWSYYCCPCFCCYSDFVFSSFFPLFFCCIPSPSAVSANDISLKSSKPFHLGSRDIFTHTHTQPTL